MLHGELPNATLRLCDFGFSKSSDQSVCKSMCGTPEYMAPEVLFEQQVSDSMCRQPSCVQAPHEEQACCIALHPLRYRVWTVSRRCGPSPASVPAVPGCGLYSGLERAPYTLSRAL